MNHHIRLKGNNFTTDPRLDRVPEWDERNRAFNVRELVEDKPARGRGWNVPDVLDQGREGACVGFAWAHELMATPDRVKYIDAGVARQIYLRAQQLDQWPGENYSGTSVLAGAKTAVEMGELKEYRWAFSLTDALRALSHEGPLVIGIDWYEGMYQPDEKGYIVPTGSVVGGHAILVSALSLKFQRVTLHNSWGPDWGRNGKAFLSISDLEWLLDEGGDCCVPIRN